MKNHDASGDKLVPTAPRNRPKRILRSIDNAMRLSERHRTVRAASVNICWFVPQARAFETGFAYGTKVAYRTGASENGRAP